MNVKQILKDMGVIVSVDASSVCHCENPVKDRLRMRWRRWGVREGLQSEKMQATI